MISFVTINISVTFALINFIETSSGMYQYISFSSGSASSQCTEIELLVGTSVKVSFEGLDKKEEKYKSFNA